MEIEEGRSREKWTYLGGVQNIFSFIPSLLHWGIHTRFVDPSFLSQMVTIQNIVY
jgi:hypothetical protein